ncbi:MULTISPECIES: hypothetical protein [Halorussus]|uniref:hypothetical protein n=1 Tax=Halorussus TaxID=1070314 RepID=UPI00209EE91C|nr:hypothetical protein [Halorussus vallis]USZ75686.1 hypothetical protein NGM07_19935 [Halorussus vallis]USZ75761.1 hypothetical protein NGM07_00170 [Halorussus vallis]
MEMTTHFELLTRESGDQYGVATGEISCDRCHAVSLHVEHIDHEVWCPNSEHYDERPPARTPMGWIVPERPERSGHDPRIETCMVAARTRTLNPMDYADCSAASVEESLDFFGQFLRRADEYHLRRHQHDYNDLDWRLDELRPEEVNAPEHRLSQGRVEAGD